MDRNIEELVNMSKYVGINPDLVQGGGGNTSIKLDDTRMIIKASGFELKNIEKNDGFVMVNYKNIKEYFSEKSGNNKKEESKSIIEKNIIKIEGMNALRPSIEAGFHSLLKKYVIHTHSVYANLLSCAVDGEKIFAEIMKKHQISFTWVNYVNPGDELTYRIAKKITHNEEKEEVSEIILLENHGIIINSDNYDKVVKLNSMVNSVIKEHFDICDNYPEILVEKFGEENYIGNTEYSRNFLNNESIFDKVIFPDQIVYFDNNISFNKEKKKINVDLKEKKITYFCKEREAKAIEETVIAYLYIITNIEKNNMKVKWIEPKDVEIVKNMESEKYRRNLLNNEKK